MNDQLKIQQVLSFASLGVSYDNPKPAHLGALQTYQIMATLLFARHGSRKLHRASNILAKKVNAMIDAGIKSPVAETNLAAYFVKIFGDDNYSIADATFDAEEVIGRRRAAVEWYDGLSEADKIKFQQMATN